LRPLAHNGANVSRFPRFADGIAGLPGAGNFVVITARGQPRPKLGLLPRVGRAGTVVCGLRAQVRAGSAMERADGPLAPILFR
jgi:hypothetical protein